jgi:type I restriction enzyme, S subunit
MKDEQNINGLPKNWKVRKLGEVAKFIDYRGRTPKKTSSGIPLITAKNVKMGFINEEPREFIAQEDYETWMTRGIPKTGDVLFTTEAPLGNVAQLKTNDKIALAQRMITFQSYELMNSSFLKYGLMSPQFQELLNSKGTGTTVKGIKAAILKQLEIAVPPKEDQQQIVSKIEELFSELDKGIEELKTAQQQLKFYRQAVLKWAFEGKLTNENLKEGELPKGWKNATIGDVCTSVEYGSSTKSKITGKVPVLRMGNIQNGIFEWDDLVYTDDDDEINKYLLKTNDVLFNRTNSAELVGKTAIYKGERPAIFAGYLIRINRLKKRLMQAT